MSFILPENKAEGCQSCHKAAESFKYKVRDICSGGIKILHVLIVMVWKRFPK